MSSIREIAKSGDERKDKSVETFTKLHLLYEKARKVAPPVQVANVVELRWKVNEFKGELEEKGL